ncbi:MAG: hypothetical protein ABSG92_08875 [Conexivisphaerales archaeon]
MRKGHVAAAALLVFLVASTLAVSLMIQNETPRPSAAGPTHDELRALGWKTLVNITRGGDPPPTVEWDSVYGGTGPDTGQSAVQTSDGGFVLAGDTNSYGVSSQQAWLVRTDSTGNVIWNYTYGGTAGNYVEKVVAAGDGGFVVAGYTNSTGAIGYTPARGAGGYDAWLFKVSSTGSLTWEKLFGGASNDYIYSVQKTSDGGYILVGGTYSSGAGGEDVWLIKTDSDGNMQWSKTYGTASDDVGYAVAQTSDGGYIIGGSTMSSGSGDVYFIKTDASGNLQNSTIFGGAGVDAAYGVAQAAGGGYIIEANTKSFGTGASRIWMLKLDTSLSTVWNYTYGTSVDTYGYSLLQSADGGLLVAGSISNSTFGLQVFIMKTDSQGSQIWNMTFGGAKDDVAYSITPTGSDGYIVAAATASFSANNRAWLIDLGSDFFFYPYVQNGILNATMIAGLSAPHGPSGAANSLDTVAGMEVAEGMGAMKSSGYGQYFLDTDVSVYNGTSGIVSYIYSPLNNIITIGGPGVNQVTYKYFANPFYAPVYETFNSSSGKFDIISPTRTYYESDWVNSSADLVVLQSIYVVNEGRYVMYLGGFGGPATRAACLIMELQGSGILPFTLQGRAMIIQWVDSNHNDKVDSGDTFNVIEIVP